MSFFRIAMRSTVSWLRRALNSEQLQRSRDQVTSAGGHIFIYGPESKSVSSKSTTPPEQLRCLLHHDRAGINPPADRITRTITGKCTYNAYGTPTCEGTATTQLQYNGQCTNCRPGVALSAGAELRPEHGAVHEPRPAGAVTGEPYTYTSDDPSNGDDPTGLSGLFGTGLGPNIGPDINWGEVAVPIAEGVGTDAACATPYVDIVTCPEAITAVTAVNNEH